MPPFWVGLNKSLYAYSLFKCKGRGADKGYNPRKGGFLNQKY